MQITLDGYTKFILTVIAIALILNVFSPFVYRAVYPESVYASSGVMDVRITDIRSTWPAEVKVTNWPSKFPQQ